ncbi:MAG: hypothetical protein H7831_13820 [Magnetococcus sp. WYHC-3]
MCPDKKTHLTLIRWTGALMLALLTPGSLWAAGESGYGGYHGYNPEPQYGSNPYATDGNQPYSQYGATPYAPYGNGGYAQNNSQPYAPGGYNGYGAPTDPGTGAFYPGMGWSNPAVPGSTWPQWNRGNLSPWDGSQGQSFQRHDQLRERFRPSERYRNNDTSVPAYRSDDDWRDTRPSVRERWADDPEAWLHRERPLSPSLRRYRGMRDYYGDGYSRDWLSEGDYGYYGDTLDEYRSNYRRYPRRSWMNWWMPGRWWDGDSFSDRGGPWGGGPWSEGFSWGDSTGGLTPFDAFW